MKTRHDARILALRALYAVIILEYKVKEAWEIFEVPESKKKLHSFALSLIEGTLENLESIDCKIKKHAKNWEMERIAEVDKLILRLALFEIIYDDSIPVNVSINEAVELAKKFSTDKSHKFVNGILDSAAKEISLKKT